MSDSSYFARLSLSQSYKRTWEIFRNNVGVFLPLTAVALFPMMLVIGTSAHLIISTTMSFNRGELPPYFDHAVSVVSLIAVEAILYIFTSLLGRGAIVHGAAEVYAGKKPHWCTNLKHSLTCFCRIFTVGMMFAGAILAGYVVFVVLGMIIGVVLGMNMASDGGQIDPNQMDELTSKVFLRLLPAVVLWILFMWHLTVVFMMTLPVIIVEDKPAVAAVARALDLADKRWCYIFCHYFVFALATAVFNLILFFTLGQTNGHQSLAGLIVSNVTGYLPQIFFLPFFNILQTIVYLSLRVDKEGMNRQVLLSDMGPGNEGVSGDHEPLVSLDMNLNDAPLLEDQEKQDETENTEVV